MDEEKIINEIADIVYKNCGIVFKETNILVLKSRISQRLKEKNLSLEKYFELLKSDKEELQSFVDFVTTNFTSFFRNHNQFEILEKKLIPELVKSNEKDKKIKLWSAGCATGEEPYSMAMIMNEVMEKEALYEKGWDFTIIASDISLQSLFIAREAKYSKKSMEKVKKEFIEKYFDFVDEDVFIVKEFLRKKIRFDMHNLIYDNGIRDVDVVFCRNVIIYFDQDVQKKVLENIYTSMKKGAFLFLGHSESLFGIYDRLKPFSFKDGIVYVKE
ncbi:MAG: CheR family methyltransferase [Brevinematia bacterium]